MKTVFNLYAQTPLLRQKVTLRGQSNELFVICAADSNREGMARISRNVVGASSWVLSHVINSEGHINHEYGRARYGKYANHANTRREAMKPLFDAAVLTAKLNIAKAINLYLVGGEIGLSLLAARLVTEFSANSLKGRANKP